MFAIIWRGALFAGLSLAVLPGAVRAQERAVLTLDEALARAGVDESAQVQSDNPRLPLRCSTPLHPHHPKLDGSADSGMTSTDAPWPDSATAKAEELHQLLRIGDRDG